MPNFLIFHKNKFWFYGYSLLLFVSLLSLGCIKANAQNCPPNIDFETGTFNGWTCYTGSVAAVGSQNVISLNPSGGPAPDRQTMYTANPANGMDPFGGFPVNCPNGSGHSIKLGNTSGGGEAEGISYEFTIPANENAYTLIYHYAVVFQDPNHQQNEQPRMEIEVTNVTDNIVISCASFSFFPYGSTLPGFVISPNPGSTTPVQTKDWTAVSVNLAGNAGKTIRMFFKTADCTFRRHFGYAYIDVNSECSGTFVGATYCPDDTAINVVAPYGYQGYTWYDKSLTQIMGTQQVLTLRPPPATGTTVAIKLIPYNGYGCPQTLYAQLIDTLTVVANAGTDTISCNHNPVPIGTPPKLGLVYKWSPAAGLSNPNIANPYASPDVTTSYTVTTNHDGGGCISTDVVLVKASIIDNSIKLIGKANYCSGRGDSSILRVQQTDSIQWFKDRKLINQAHQNEYKVTETGEYYAMLFNREGCSVTTTSQQITISSIPVAGFIPPDNTNQCLVGNQYVFTNTSINAIGAMQYTWQMGDGNFLSSRDIAYTYKKAGTYKVKMQVNSSSICADSGMLDIVIYQNAVADFNVSSVCINLPTKIINNTADTIGSPVNYIWTLGNGQVANGRIPPEQSYAVAGTYSISLSVNTPQCPLPYNTIRRVMVIEKPRQAISYPVEYAVINLPLPLEARKIGENVLWSPGIELDTRNSFNPVFKGPAEQLYTIEIKTNAGCITTDTQQVKIVKQVEVYVPNAFTPNHDGSNDYLHPLLRGIKQVHYFKVYNRWGQLIYVSLTDRPGWDGTYKGVAQASQAFVWVLEGLGVDGVVYTKKGTTVLLR
ncbi:MAG: PKD domain-containing protein [Chitinophagaceae bacterium]